MPLTKEEVKQAFREAMLRDYADIPPSEEIKWTPSPRFLAKMEEIKEQLKNSSANCPR